MSELDILLALASAMQQKGNVSGSALNTLFSPELAYLTGTADVDENQAAQQDELLSLQYAPNLRIAVGLDAEDIRRKIAAEIVEYNLPPWQVKAMIEEYTAAQATANPETYNEEGETADLMRFADTIFSENNALTVQKAKSSGGDDYAKTTGMLPRMEKRFTGMDLDPAYFSKVAERLLTLDTDLTKIKAPGGQTIKKAQDFLSQQEEANKNVGADPSLIRRMRGKRNLPMVTEGQLAPYVPEGKARTITTEKFPGSSIDPEMNRFGNIAKNIVARGPQNKELSTQRAGLVNRRNIEMKAAEDYGLAIQKAAEEIGYTPAMAALLQRASFLRGK
jgi:hypothetical protein